MEDTAAIERSHVARQRDRVLQFLRKGGAEIQINGPSTDCRRPGSANVRFPGHDAKSMIMTFQPGLAASTGLACSTGIPEPSYVLSTIGLSHEGSKASIRFSVGGFTTDNDVQSAAELVLETLQREFASTQTPSHAANLLRR